MSINNNTIQSLGFWIVRILFVLLPFHALLVTVLKFKAGLAAWPAGFFAVTAWKEGLIAILLLIAVINIISKKIQFKKDAITWLILLYLGIGIASYFSHDYADGFKQWLFGARFDFSFLITFLIVRHLIFSEEQKLQLIKSLLISSAIAVAYGLFAFILFFFFSPEILTYLGYRNDWSTFRPWEALAFCQKLENTGFCRLNGTFAGPNQYGIFLIVLIGLLLAFRGVRIRASHATAIITATIVSLLLTLSRSAMVGLTIAVIGFLYINGIPAALKHRLPTMKRISIWTAGILVSIAAIITIILSSDSLRSALIRQQSTAGHFLNIKASLQRMAYYPFGEGLATVGPASSYFHSPGTAFHPENWYLQVGIEMGWIGMAVFLAILATMIGRLWRISSSEGAPGYAKAALFGLIGISVAALFLHAFEDAPTTLILFSLIGMIL